jgi:AcrR family transcriptional regulator
MSTLPERIAAAAQELYLLQGVEGLSMRKVAERVGVSAPAIYRHFRNKDDLLKVIVVEGLRILESYLEPALRAPTAYERLTTLVECYLRFALEQPKYFDFAFLIPTPANEPISRELVRDEWDTFRLAVDQVSDCMAQGIFREGDALETAILVWAQVHGLVTLFRMGRFGPDQERFEQIYHQTVGRLLEALKA